MNKRIGIIMYQTSLSRGQELVAQRMVAGFNRLGHNAYLITSVYHDGAKVLPTEALPEDQAYAYSQDNELGIPIIRVDSFVSKWPPRRILFRDFVHILERIVNDFGLNVLITHSTLWNGPEEVVKFVEWRHKIRDLGGYQDPIVFCHMSHFQEPSPKRYSLVERSFRMAWNTLSLRQILRVANLILVVTPYEENAKVKMGARREKCILFPGGVDEDAFIRFASVGPEEFLQHLNVQRGVKLVSYLGTIEERKNPKAVLELATRLQDRKDLHFVVAGAGDSPYADGIRIAANELPNVTYLGEINEREKIQLIKASYLNILLSKMEALGLTQLEFMFHGVPVVTSAVGGQSWLIRHDQEGIHVKGPDDVEGASQAIVDLVENPPKWRRLSANAKARAKAFAFSSLVRNLDVAVTAELEKESGLSNLPAEVRSTLSEPEQVVKTWSHRTWKLVATNHRLFIRHGWLSRRTLELLYGNIGSIEHIRRYAWRTLLFGVILSMFLFVEPYLRPVFSRTLVSRLDQFIHAFLPNISLQLNLPDILVDNIPLVPISLALTIFAVQARKGFALHGAASRPIFLPRPFGEAIKYIRSVQDKTTLGIEKGAPGPRTEKAAQD